MRARVGRRFVYFALCAILAGIGSGTALAGGDLQVAGYTVSGKTVAVEVANPTKDDLRGTIVVKATRGEKDLTLTSRVTVPAGTSSFITIRLGTITDDINPFGITAVWTIIDDINPM